MSKAVIIEYKSPLDGAKSGTGILGSGKNMDFIIEFSGKKCPQKSKLKDQISEFLKETELVESVIVKDNKKDKGKLNVLVSISPISNSSISVFDLIHGYVSIFVENYYKTTVPTM